MSKFTQKQELYKVSVSTGKMQVWQAWTDGNKVVSKYGQLGGKMQEFSYSAEPKNLGKVNETTSDEQANIECLAMYEDQFTNKHYCITQEDALKASESCKEPRKITNYKDRYTKMSDVLLTSVKKNGSRACVLTKQLYSKIGRPEEIKVEHLHKAIEQLNEYATFDAEVYAEGLSLQRIRSAWLKPVKTNKEIIQIAQKRSKSKGEDEKFTIDGAIEYLGYNPNEDAAKLKFYIFDIPDSTGKPFTERVVDMKNLHAKIAMLGLEDYFDFLYPFTTNNHEERLQILDEVVALGNEGLVHYEPDGVYEFGKRSTNTAKQKPRYDSEALVVDVEMCKNGEGKLVLRTCDALDNVEFKAMMKGSHESRMFDVQKQFVGKWVTFEYEELSDTGTPTKPTVKETRLCDNEGNPLD